MKRILSLTLVLAMLLGLAGASALEISKPGELPLVTEPVTLTIGLPLQPECTDYYDNYFTKYIEEKTGVKLEFVLFASSGDEAKQKFTLMVSSNQTLPDIVNVGLSTVEQMDFGAAGVILPMNDWIENSAYYYDLANETWLTEGEQNDIKLYPVCPDGNIYALPSYSTTIDSVSALGMWMNKAWLDKLGLEVPTTTDELYDVLVAFRDEDPNGNGLKDEIPLTGATGWAGDVVQMILNSYLYYCYRSSYGYQLNAEDSELITPFTQDAFREGMRFVHKLYEEGLISPLSFTQSTAELRSILTAPNGEPSLVGAFVSHPSPVFGSTGDVERVKEYVALPAMVGPEGVAYTAHEAVLPSGNVYITKDCQYPELAFRFLDALREQTTNISSRFGAEGIDWEYVSEGNIAVKMEGFYPLFVEKTERPSPWTSSNNIIWGTTSFSFLPAKLMGCRVMPSYDSELRKYQMIDLWYDTVPLRSGKHPAERPLNIILTQEESDAINEVRSSIRSYVDTSTTRFLTGDLSLDDDWDAYLKTLKEIGLDNCLEALQGAYDRMNGK